MPTQEVSGIIKNYIFDFGNVLARFYPDELTAPYVADLPKRSVISRVAFDRLYWDRLDQGTLSDDEVKKRITIRLSEEGARLGCLAYDNWVRNLTPVKGMEELVKQIHQKGGKLYLLSNISQKFAAEYKEVEWINRLLGLFDGLVFSSNLKLVKPQKEIFEHLLSAYSLDPAQCLFIDDNKGNIEGAKKAGINGYLFDGDAQRLKEHLGL